MIAIKTTTMIMSLPTNFYLNTIRLWFSPSIIFDACSSSQKHGLYLKSLPRNSHRKKNSSFNTYPSTMQPSRRSFCRTYHFRVFIYLSKKSIHLVDMTPTNSMPSTRCISKWMCRSMKLVGRCFSNTHTISTISSFHFGTSHLWISLDVTHLI